MRKARDHTVNDKQLARAGGCVNMDNRFPELHLEEPELRSFFLSHLNRIYCAKSQLVDKLPQLSRQAHYLDLKQAIDETVEAVELQVQRMRQIFILMDAIYQYENCTGLVGLLDEAFQSISPISGRPALRDLSILFYMQNIESIEMASFKMMLMVADSLHNPEIYQLLLECFDEAKEDRVLFKQLTEMYI
jgi:ferritin-like metal-binding protein YciE